MTLDDFLSGFDRVRRSGSGSMARCPSHDDRHNSLSVREGDDGRVLIKCHAGCSAEEIVAARGLTMRDLMPEEASVENTQRVIAATYDYRDEGGTSLYQVVRFVPKRFAQRRSSASGDWIWNTDHVRRVLYRLPELLGSPSRRVFVVEGERDVDRLESLGLLATTNSGGAGKWRPQYSEVLRGRDVVLIPDNDDAGRRHVEQVGRSLRGIAASVRVLTLPMLPLKGDVSSWLDSGRTVEELERLAGTASEWNGPTGDETRRSALTLTRLGDLLSEPEEQARWLVDGMLPAGGVSLIVAKPKVGKSTLARQLALAVVRGEPFLGRSVTPGLVVYLALEEKRSEVRSHFRAMGARDDEMGLLIHFGTAPQDTPGELRRLTGESHPALVIVDPLFRAARVKDANDYIQVTAAFEPYLAYARETGAHVLAVHHAGKGDRSGADAILGSTAILGSVDTALLMKRSDRFRSVWTVQRYGGDLLEIVLDFDTATRLATAGKSRDEAEQDRLIPEFALALQGKSEPLTEEMLLEEVEGKTGPKRKALRALHRAGRICRTGGGKRGDPFLYQNARSLVPEPSTERENENPQEFETPVQGEPDSRSKEARRGVEGGNEHEASQTADTVKVTDTSIQTSNGMDAQPEIVI